MKIIVDIQGCGEDAEAINCILDAFAESISVVQSLDPDDERANDVVEVFGLVDPCEALKEYVASEWLSRWLTIPDEFEVSIKVE